MTIAILCGGSGTRLWPLSRSLLPKQFAPLLESGSFFTQTLLRNAPLIKSHNAHFQIIANEVNYFIAQDQAKQAKVEIQSYILETIGKNTAPALCLSALDTAFKYDKDEIILALPSDHLIKDSKAYQKAIQEAIEYAKNDYLVTFGIKPKSPHTGYGYIECEKNGNVKKFTEKPDQKLAQTYLEEGNHFWNSGMFCFKASVFLDELQRYSKKVYDACIVAYENSDHNEIYTRINSELSEKIPEISIDYALMEKSKKIKCVIGDFSWSDVGSFESLNDEWPKDTQGNASRNDIIAKNSENNFILSDKFVATIGIKDLIIVDTNDSLLLAKKGESQAIKDIVTELKKTRPELTQIHTTAYRPWGSYTVLLESSNYKIKQIIVKPKCRLSLQKHFHRNEHWVVVSGSANVKSGDKEIFLKANESTYIPMGQLHRLENQGKIDLVIIEIQVGEYLGEDDIVRIEDDFRRC
ncbi:mannose-1-phosphate guanylyltransferase/mannose-6-phosphate isomerase [Helicobacter cappadocius]|uniref:mannose-1-phosphate guanylyltransferase n=1 Tax=Helicobacter cappadocius TaxID=3063998 RepID=A0AA90PR82_9HELI|nr:MULTISPECIES: mannose-1-phosphate guanylyltransferase/mannose-6-phosphate isomerase [unclassified Helicobacter]MDO7253782.1 mannose-1-phosphate guanylyltransferase/mannose-6-phosphate isomerase [Helicobacter sp. faydin-H75]MDP2538662.1 mannose-1-phosphate guanylyltransferase/mannose-6-phosphate isomerase [Helicobacter sp. faydin-H76]